MRRTWPEQSGSYRESGSAPCELAALYDIHANLPALEAVLAEIRREGIDQLVIGGDVLPGPMPGEHDPDEVPEEFRDVILWTARQLEPRHQDVIAGWPPMTTLETPPFGEALFRHATSNNDTDIFTGLTPEERVRSLLGDTTRR